MKLLILVVGWCILLALSWHLAVVVLIATPIILLVWLPLRLLGLCVEGIFALLRAIVLLPARLLGHRSRS
jgi:hypothetical protein